MIKVKKKVSDRRPELEGGVVIPRRGSCGSASEASTVGRKIIKFSSTDNFFFTFFYMNNPLRMLVSCLLYGVKKINKKKTLNTLV